MAGEAGAAADWRAGLPAEIAAAPALKDVKDVAGLAQAFVDTKALVGASIHPPGPDAGPEARKEFVAKLQAAAPELVLFPEDPAALAEVEASIWARLGKPKEAKEYAAPKDVELPEAALDALRAEAAEEGLTRRQFEARAKRVAGQVATAQHAQAEAQAALKRELGVAYDERIGAAASAAERLGFPPALVTALKAGQVDLATYKALAAVAKGFGEGRQVADQGAGGGRVTPAEALLQAAEIRARKGYWDSADPTHAGLLQKHLDLMKQAYPEG